MANKITELKQKLLECGNIGAISGILEWDMQTMMPAKSSHFRGMQSSTVSGITHNLATSKELGDLINSLKEDSEYSKLNEDDKIIVDRALEDYTKAKKMPVELVKEVAQASSEAHVAWEEARKRDDFDVFKPHLEKMVGYSKKVADIYGYEKSPYDALVNEFEKGLTTEELDSIFGELKDAIIPFLDAIKNSSVKTSHDLVNKFYPEAGQWELCNEALNTIGYDFTRGRLDKSTHPFTTGFNPNDVRVTTRIDENYVCESFLGTIHEGGHGLYEQGLSVDNFGNALGQSVSLGVHESQSRLWENLVGRSKQFLKFFYPKFQKQFPENLKSVSFEDFYKSFNHVEPSLIRVGADEVTYNLHIILRYEMERDVIEGKIKVADFPEIWNEKMKKYLGITPPSVLKGVLQDVHWTGLMGYFPSYSIGNIYSAQLYHKVLEEIPDLEDQIGQGDPSKLLDWLREKVHKHGRRYDPKILIEKATGEKPTARYFIDYINDRYGEIYEIARMMM